MTPREVAIHAQAAIWREEREDWRVARIVAAIYDQNRNPKKRKQPYTAKDFMPKPKAAPGARTPEAQKMLLDGLVHKTRGWTSRHRSGSTASSTDPATP